MDEDVFFLGGCLFVIMAFLATVGAMADGVFPRVALVFVILGGGLIGYAVWKKPGIYSFQGVPDVITRVFGTLF